MICCILLLPHSLERGIYLNRIDFLMRGVFGSFVEERKGKERGGKGCIRKEGGVDGVDRF